MLVDGVGRGQIVFAPLLRAMADSSSMSGSPPSDDQSHEEELHGGNVSRVVRIGGTVRRPTGPWTPSVHRLLRHLEDVGYAGAPRVLGIDEQGREILSYLPGEIGHYPGSPAVWSDATLARVAGLVRALHDATTGLPREIERPWRMAFPDPDRHEVICHNDIAPYNGVFVAGELTAFIDWDFAGPGPRIWDIAHAVYRFVPLTRPAALAELPLPPRWDEGRRLSLFCEHYGLDDRSELVGAVLKRVGEMTVSGPHVDHYRQDLHWLEGRRKELEQVVAAG